MIVDKTEIRILVIEQDAIIAESLSLLLGGHGYCVQSADTAEQAIALAIDLTPHLLIVEPHLQTEMKGVDVANTILSFNPTAEIIFLTAWSLEARKFSIKKPCEVVSKPYDEVEILKLLRSALKLPSAFNETDRHTKP